ncbi:MAG: tetratricopeptide repeat protein [Anaerolineales bacterium]|nr:tetratricopeptide repeat protein [Anaerolineales bacterium]
MVAIDALRIYLPIDRCHALANGETIPDRVQGAALFADISGFTPLTGALAAELGRQRGAEAVLDYINPIYEALVGKLHEYRGSVIGFAGDSITCWLDGDDGRRAAACALAMQAIMVRYALISTEGGAQVGLSIKIGVAAGPARRFLAGNPKIHNFEALAGATLERMAAAEGLAQKGEVVASQEIVENLGEGLRVSEWRREEGTGRVFGVVSSLEVEPPLDPWPMIAAGALSEDQVRPWIDPPVYARLASGAAYLAELRPVTSLFLKFGGIDYDGDDRAGQKLDAFVRWAQAILARYDGTMLQLTIGDKGSNILAAFGAPVAHDDDEARAVAAALDLQALPGELDFIPSPKIGLSQGLAWAGACGGRVRCIYTVMGDEVNMAARLMGRAVEGQILVNQRLADATARLYRYNSLGAIQVKGRLEPLPVSEAIGRREAPGAGLAALFHTPLVGREDYLEAMNVRLESARCGEGQALRLEGPAGVGKSHLAAVFAEGAATRGWQAAVGLCQSISQESPYTPWRGLLAALLDLGEAPPEVQIARLEAALLQERPEWETRLPLLGDLLGLPIPDNPVSAALEPGQRREALFSLAAEIVQAWAERAPLLLVLEDVHWIDEASADLAVAVARAIARSPALLLVVQRPPLAPAGGEAASPSAAAQVLPELDHLPHYHFIQLGDLSQKGVAALANNRLGGPLSQMALALVMAQAQGNPFFSEELLDALREAGYIEPGEGGAWDLSARAFEALLDGGCLVKVEGEWGMVEDPPLSAAALDIPDSVHGTVLARMDRLEEAHKLTLKVASVIGRAFALDLLRDVHPAQPAMEALRSEIEAIGGRDFVRLEQPGEVPVYIFKHNTTQEVAYGTLLFAQRQALHRGVAEWHERAYGDAPLDELDLESRLAPYYPALAYHWRQAEERGRERVYAGLAGQAAARKYANESAARLFSRALELTPQDALGARYRLLVGREAVYDVLSQREVQSQDLSALSDLADRLQDVSKRALVSLRRARYADLTNDPAAALEATQAAAGQAAQAQDMTLQARAYHQWGRLLWKQGRYAEARQQLERGLELAQAAGSRLEEGRCYDDLASAYSEQAIYDEALEYYQRAQAIYKEIDYSQGEITCLINTGVIRYEAGDYITAEKDYQRALMLSRVIGWRYAEQFCCYNLGNIAFDLGDYTLAQINYEQSLVLAREMGNRYVEALSQDTLGLVFYILGDNIIAQEHAQHALVIQSEINDRRGQGYTLGHLALICLGQGKLEDARVTYEQSLSIWHELGQEVLVLDDLAGLARLALAEGHISRAVEHVEETLEGIASHGVDGTEFPVLVYLTCYQVLRAAGDLERAGQALGDGYDLLQKRASLIQDEDLREQFLTNVPFNRDLLTAWEGGQG